MKGAKQLLVLAAALLLFAGCGGQVGDPRKVNASVGTWNYGGQNVGAAYVLWADLPQPTSPDGFTLTISGPNNFSWNPRLFRSFAGVGFWWAFTSSPVPPSGSYTLSANLTEGLTLNRTMSVNASSTLPQPQNVSLETITSNSARVTWSAVSGAKSYYVELWQLDDQNRLSALRRWWYTTSTQFQFTQAAGITLSPGNYRARVFAANVDFTRLPTPGQASQLDPQFLLSSALSAQVLQVQSVGTLRVLDLGPVADPGVAGGQE